MKWFTKEWHRGDLTDADYDLAIDSYQEHVARLRSGSVGWIAPLLDLSLHDGLVLWWRKERRDFAWCLVVGDLQRGYKQVTIVYQDAQVIGDPRAIPFSEEQTESLSEEIEMVGLKLAEHRFFFWPEYELAIRFSAVSVSTSPADSRERR